MSYILDALRRADAERERGHVPGIHAQPTRTAASSGVARTTHRLGLWGAVVVLLLAIGVLSWRLLGQETGAPTVAAVAAPSPSTSPHGSSVAAPAVAALTPAVEPSVSVTPPKVAATAPALPTARQTVAGVAGPIRKTPAAVPGPRAVPETHASAAAASSATVYTADELPEEVRRDLPKLAIGGSIYSESAASRFVILNGQLLHEGDTVVPGVTLQQIKLKSAVLAFRGYRYRIAL